MNPITNVPPTSSSHRRNDEEIHPDSFRPFGFNIIGYVSANSGVSVSTRQLTRLILDQGYPVAILDLDPGLGKYKHDRTFDRYAVNSIDELPFGVNLLAIFIHMLPEFLIRNAGLLRNDRLNVGFIAWELTQLPPIWRKALEVFDVVMANSHFVRSAFESQLSQVLTLYAACTAYQPGGIHADRRKFGLPEKPVLFVYSFDPYGDPERKNPFGVLNAFKQAFPTGNAAHLVIKINNSAGKTEIKPSVSSEMLKIYCDGDPRVHIISDPLTYTEVLNLYTSCDVFVSLHRAEGFGLGLMEAMALGKPVVATAWSGNLTFMDHTNSCLVRYHLVPARGAFRIYNKEFLETEALWADPDINHAAAWMKRLAGNAQLRESIGRKAAEDIVEFQRKAERGNFIHELRAIWTNRQFLPDRTEDKQRHLESLRLFVEEDALKWRPGRVRRILDRHLLWRFAWLNGSAKAQDRQGLS